MCGLVAIFSPQRPIAQDALRSALAQLHHRGPDHQTIWTAAEGGVAFGHARLAIVDRTGGNQPISNEDGSIHVITNGEFYDFVRLRQQLSHGARHRFASGSDAEILPHLYEEYGEECLQYLRGEFAFVLWDARQRRLLAARDRFGIKPLYYTSIEGVLLLATSVRSLYAAGAPAAWDETGLLQQLFGCCAGGQTLFRGIHQIPPGHYLTATEGELRLRRYWDLDYPAFQSVQGSGTRDTHAEDSTSVAGFRELLAHTVGIRLHGDVPVGCFLSGGVDSSSVFGLAARSYSGRVHAFTVAYTDEAYNEAEIASESARHHDAAHELIPVGVRDYADCLADAVWHAETLAFNLHGVARYVLCKRIQQIGYRAALSGEGADELLAGYGFARHDLTVDATQPGGLSPEGEPLEAIRSVLGFVPHWLGRLALSRSIFHLFLDPGIAERLELTDTYAQFLGQFDYEGQLRGRAPVHQSLYLWNRSILPNYVLAAERLEMAHAVEVRLPFLDHHLFEYLRGLPFDLLLRGAQEKYLLREAARGVLTDTVYRRSKQPFTAPPEAVTPGSPLYELVQDTLRSPAMAAVPFFSRPHVLDYLDDPSQFPPSMRYALDAAMLAMVSACVLQERLHLG